MSKEHAYAYEAGYRDGSIHYELDHCPACKNVADLQEALTENDRLRELVRDLVTTVRGCGQDEDGYGQLPCDEVCPHWSNDGECTRLHRDQCWYEEQARELGVDV